jgi:hypothetical protein
MKRYKVGAVEFDTFDQVIQWAWDNYKICEFPDTITEEQEQRACRELETMIKEDV